MTFRYKHSLLNRAMSSMLAFLLVLISVVSPLNTVPTYATGSWVNVSYHQDKNEDIDIAIISENDSFESEEDVSLKLYIRNNTEETLYQGSLSFNDSKDVFSDAGFVLPEDSELYIGEKGNLGGITLAPGEVLEAEFAGTIMDNAKLEGKRSLGFFFGAKDANDNPFTRRVAFDYVTGYMTFLPVEYADGTEIAAGENGTMTFRLTMDQSSHVFEKEESYVVATDSDANVASDSDADLATDSDADLATDSDADEESVSLSHVNFHIVTSDVAFENVKLIEAKQIQTMNGTFEVEATVGFIVGAETEVGTHYGNVNATVKVGKKTYDLSQGFEIEVTGFTKAELEAVQNVIDLIAKLPTLDEFFAAMGKFFPEDGPEDEAGYEAYIREITKLAVPAFEAYEELGEELKALIDPADVEKLLFIYGLCDPTTLDEKGNYIALNWSGGGTLKIYCEGIKSNNERVDMLAYAQADSLGLVNTLDTVVAKTSSISVDAIINEVGTVLETLESKMRDVCSYSYNDFELLPFDENETIRDDIEKISYNISDGSGMDWHYTTTQYGENTWGWEDESGRDGHMNGSANTSEARLVIYYDITTPELLRSIDNPTKLNATVQLFDYNAGSNGREGINLQGLGAEGYYFYAWDDVSQIKDKYEYRSGETFTIDGKEVDEPTKYRSAALGSVVPMAPTLDGPDGYPLTTIYDSNGNNYSLAYLFNNQAVDGKVIYPEMTDGGGLFQYDQNTGYYEYDSAKNAAYYDGTRFTLYDGVLRPAHINSENQLEEMDSTTNEYKRIVGTRESNFLPFNEPWVDLSDGHKLDEYTVDTAVQVAIEEIDGEETIKPTGGKETMSPTSYPLDWYYGVPGEIDTRTDYWFGMTLEFEFMMPKNGKVPIKDDAGNIIGDQDMIFEFNGDDDVWVYIDDQLVLDIGACHEDRRGYINFAEGIVSDPTIDGTVSSISKDLKSIFNLQGNTFEDYTVHKLKFFYMERGGSYSYCKIKFNLPVLDKNSILVTKELTADANIASIGNPDFKFQILSKDGTTPFIKQGEAYKVLNKDGAVIETREMGENGIFVLKADQTAVFPDITEDRGEYFVRELMSTEDYKQYGTVFVDGKATTTGDSGNEKPDTFNGVDSVLKDISNGTTSFIFKNRITTDKLGKLTIKKNLDSLDDKAATEAFKMSVTFNGAPIAAGTKYIVNGVREESVEEAGYIVIKHGEEAVIPYILNGTTYTVEEQLAEDQEYTVSYQVNGGTVTYEGPVSGTITTGTTVSILVNNHEGDWVELQGLKKIKNPDGADHNYSFDLVEVNSKTDLTPKSDAVSKEVFIGSTADSNTFAYKLKYYAKDYPSDGTQVKYYLITEDNSAGGNVIYDSTKYLVEVTITTKNGIVDAKNTGLWKVGSEGALAETTGIEFTNILLTDLTVTKEIKGNMAELDKQFKFNITVIFDGNEYTDYEITTANDANLNPGDDYEFALSDNQSVLIKNLPIGATVTVTEANEGYVAYYQVGSNIGTDSRERANVTEVTVATDTSDNILFINEKNAIIDTGITMDTLPYILIMLAVIGGIVFTVIRKRKEDELD